MTDASSDSTSSPVQADLVNSPTSVEGITQSKFVVLGVLFLVTGALGLPLLWVNRRFSPIERVIWTVAVSTYTLLLIGFTLAVIRWAYQQIFP